MTKNVGKNFLKCLICLSSHSHRIADLFYAQYKLVRETPRTTTAIRQETWGKTCREAKESVYLMLWYTM